MGLGNWSYRRRFWWVKEWCLALECFKMVKRVVENWKCDMGVVDKHEDRERMLG